FLRTSRSAVWTPVAATCSEDRAAQDWHARSRARAWRPCAVEAVLPGIAMRLRLALGMRLCALALGLPGLCVSAQPATVGEPIVVGQRFELRSESMGEVRSFQVHRPPNYDISATRYPVLIVLDGNEHFQHVSATVDFLAAAGKIPGMLVIGIPNTDRFRDLVSTAAPDSSPFLTFIRGELVPRIDRDYRTRPYRILVGHSDAGLFTLYSMIQ